MEDDHVGDSAQIEEIASFMTQNPGAILGIDGGSATAPDALRTVSLRRTNAVRQALVSAGVASSRMETGAFSNTASARASRVEVLIKSAR
jgi:outer membrane protein OmpA-like peptidoglycan-associated protein